MLHPTKRMLLIRSQDRAATYIVTALAVPVIVFGGVAITVMLGSPPEFEVVRSLLPVLFWDFLALGALLAGFRLYCWFSYGRWLNSDAYGSKL